MPKRKHPHILAYYLIKPYLKIIRYGKYFDPASEHYKIYCDKSSDIVVDCDRCKTNNLKTCIGYDKMDLCLKCYKQIRFILVVDNLDINIF